VKRLKRKKPYLGPQWVRWLLFMLLSAAVGYAVTRAILPINFPDAAELAKWVDKYPNYIALTTLIYGLLTAVLGAVTGRLWIGALATGAVAVSLSLVDYFKTAINGTPLSLADFGLATQLGEVAGVAGTLTPPEGFWKLLVPVLACVAVLIAARRLTVLRGRCRFLSASLLLAALLGMFSPMCAPALGEVFSVDVYSRMPAAHNNSFHGLTLALWRDCVVQPMPAPEGYSRESMEQVLARIDELLLEDGTAQEKDDAGVRPNIIMILSEAFFDVTRLPDLTYGADPLSNYHALKNESISGTFYSHYLGYGTGYLEIAMLCGVSNMDFGASTNICFMENGKYELFSALPEQYTESGNYRAEMFHAYNDSLYNRTVTYPLLGCSALSFSADMQKMGVEWGGSVYGGYYLKDAFMYKAMLQRMNEINASGQQAFLYGITMENHQPFDPEKFGGACQVGAESELLSPEDLEIAKVMVEGMTRADQALGSLVAALRESDQPTVVVFFGDHRPNLFLTDGDTIYTKYGLCPSNDMTQWTPKQVADLYSTDYLIWANDAALLQGQAGTEKDSSITAVGPQLLGLTGAPVSRYWGLLQKVSEVCLTNGELYFADGQGAISASEADAALTQAQRELLELRAAVLYDAFFGKNYITAAMNEAPGT